MQLSSTLQSQIRRLALKYGNGNGLGEDMAEEAKLKVLQLPDETAIGYAVVTAENACLDVLRDEEKHWTGVSTDDPSFVEPIWQGRSIDVDKYRDKIKDKRLQLIIDQVLNMETVSDNDRQYLCYHRFELDRSFEKYLKPISQFMLFYRAVAPFHVALS